MKITKTIDEVRKQVKEWRRQGLTVGLVPTMGYLHEGHKSLIDRAVAENDKVVVSDFVNPIQFGVNEDLATYPRDIEADKRLCEQAGADLIFHPEVEEMYAPDFFTYVEMQKVSEGLCGKTRPTHFRGVCTVVCKLFHIVMPDRAYFGQKDAQQLAVIRRMVRDLNMDIQIVGCPIIREEDGLAKSSRNTYLNAEERKSALVLSKAVFHGMDMMKRGERNADAILTAMRKLIEEEPLAKIDYVEMVNADSIEPLAKAEGRVLVDNGARFETYVIAGEAGSGIICLNGAAARMVSTGDKVIIMCYAGMTPEERKDNPPKVVFVDDENKITSIACYEKHGMLGDI